MSTTDPHMDGHLTAAKFENATFLMNTCGLSQEMTARRLGMTTETLDKLMRRHGWTKEREE